jgi:hypothetical protein
MVVTIALPVSVVSSEGSAFALSADPLDTQAAIAAPQTSGEGDRIIQDIAESFGGGQVISSGSEDTYLAPVTGGVIGYSGHSHSPSAAVAEVHEQVEETVSVLAISSIVSGAFLVVMGMVMLRQTQRRQHRWRGR